ncbi:ABC transporter ATP-binding protein [Dongia deserti]|uniref:ABC transporter ATP-binding protein n=1 Tax=Dongia deserti TaxID=2268030 RepID=UPI000E6485C6|nr:sn-glycerol-3-phosphate ABC transporter ATP-binding protein UgpC [Dongia deserti]
MATLAIRNVTKNYGDLEVLRGINIDADDGEFLVLLGPSGCGKSTLLNAIAGLEAISGGDILIDGSIVTGLEPRERDIAMVFQSYALYPTMSVRKNIEFGMRVRGVPPGERRAAVEKVAQTLQLSSLLDRKPSQLSGGQRQRVAMGRALVREPKVFLFDEPLSNLDAKLRIEMRAEIKRLHQNLETTIVYVTHDQIEAMTLATKVVVMRGGVVQQVGRPQDIYDRPANLYVAGFIGSPPMNFIPADLTVEGERIQARIARNGAAPVAIDVGPITADRAVLAGREVILGVRPEALTEAGEAVRPGKVAIDATIEILEPTGADTFAVISLGGAAVTARCHPRAFHSRGPARFELDTASVLIFDPGSERRID